MTKFHFPVGCSLLFLVGLFIGNTDTVSENAHQLAGLRSRNVPAKDRRSHGPSAFDLANSEALKEIQSNFDEGISFPPMDITFRPFQNGWDITDKLARILDLDRKERSDAQRCIDSSKIAFERLVNENSMPAKSLRGVEPAPYTFRVRPFKQSGHNELHTLHDRLVKALGDDKGNELFGYFRWRPHLGAFGANDVEITFYPPVEKGPSKVLFTRRKSMTGISISSGELTEEQLWNAQGYKRTMFK